MILRLILSVIIAPEKARREGRSREIFQLRGIRHAVFPFKEGNILRIEDIRHAALKADVEETEISRFMPCQKVSDDIHP